MNCIYYDMKYVNCTWERNEVAPNGVNDMFYYWFSRQRLQRELCSWNKENQSCRLEKKREIHRWLWLCIKMSNNFTLLAPHGFQLQERGPHRLINQKSNTSDLNCTYYDNGNLSCKWIQEKDAKQNSSYEIYYRLSKTALRVKHCNKYLQNQSLNLGCLLIEDGKVFEINFLYTYVIDSNRFTVVEPHGHVLVENVKLSPPQNLSAESSGKEELSLTWDIPKHQKPELLLYQMEYKSNMDSHWQVKDFQSRSFTLSSVDSAKRYFFRLRSKLNDLHAKNSYWSEWGPTFIWKGPSTKPTINPLLLVLTLAAVLAIAALASVFYKVKRVSTWLFPGIPDPKYPFVDLFDDYNGNFQEWIGVSKYLDINSASECIPTECQIEEEPVRLKIEHEDPQQPPIDKIERSDSVPESINGENEKSVEDVPNSQSPVHETAAIDMSKLIMDKNMYVRL
ncbi:cytokine receptor common subunit gamma-like [Scyliorhinus torazame]|uniref:cytokine receptor common subunit gamma-like n=1 Tax=Scyliorhinus torazame TaxID=75743 RepID=UPI003B58E2F8